MKYVSLPTDPDQARQYLRRLTELDTSARFVNPDAVCGSVGFLIFYPEDGHLNGALSPAIYAQIFSPSEVPP